MKGRVNATANGKAKAMMPIVVIIIALSGFVATSAWQQQQTLHDLRVQLEAARKNLGAQISAQAEQIALRESSIRALSEDLMDQSQKIKEMENILATEKRDRQSSVEKVMGLEEKLSQQVKNLEQTKQRLKEYETWKKEMHAYKAVLEQQVQELKGLVTDQEKQILLIKEDVLLKKTLETGIKSQMPEAQAVSFSTPIVGVSPNLTSDLNLP